MRQKGKPAGPAKLSKGVHFIKQETIEKVTRLKLESKSRAVRDMKQDADRNQRTGNTSLQKLSSATLAPSLLARDMAALRNPSSLFAGASR